MRVLIPCTKKYKFYKHLLKTLLIKDVLKVLTEY